MDGEPWMLWTRLPFQALFALWVLWSAEIWPVKSEAELEPHARIQVASRGTRRYVCADQFSVFGDTTVNRIASAISFVLLFCSSFASANPSRTEEAEALRRDLMSIVAIAEQQVWTIDR